MLSVEFCETTGSIAAISGSSRSLTSPKSVQAPLFSFRMLKTGCFSFVNSLAAGQVEYQASGDDVTIRFSDFPDYPGLRVETMTSRQSADSLAWTITISNQTDYAIDTVDYPCLTVPNDLRGNGGESCIFRPFGEGVEITALSQRNPESDVDLNRDYNAMYPGFSPVQFMGYYNGTDGLYFAAHDVTGTPKIIEAYQSGLGIRLSFRAFHGIGPMSVFSPDYAMVTSQCGGSWHDCAEMYRRFIESSGIPLPKKIHQNKSLPAWFHQSPIVVIYPPRSIRGSGYLGPNEFFPYVNGIKYLEELSEAFEAPILSLLAYWEGSAPWCPPFNWPPYGGEESFAEYVAGMHARGFSVGLYGSGLNWTDKSLLCPEFDKTAYRIENQLDNAMCERPDGSLWDLHYPNIRDGYRMCSACDSTRQLAIDQIDQMAAAGVDFIQYFDQNHGGLSWMCYAAKHPHPAGYGSWAVRSLRSLYSEINARLKTKGGTCLIGTEQSVSECFVGELPLNDRRAIMTYRLGKPVPAYEYIFHEYAASFLGNLNGSDQAFPVKRNPDLLRYLLAEGFIAGCLLAVNMKSGGELHWEWGMSWIVPGPRQKEVIACVKDFQAMRTGNGKPYLCYGRMLKPLPAETGSASRLVLIRADGSEFVTSTVLSAKWRAPDGSEAQIFANADKEPQMVAVDIADSRVLRVFTAHGELPFAIDDVKGVSRAIFSIPPCSSAGIELA